MTSKAKIKGSNFEREIAAKLSSVFGGSFIRSNLSGAYTGGSNAFRKSTLSVTQQRNCRGDITPPDHFPRMVIEAKNYKEFPFHQLMQNCSQLNKWIEQTEISANDNDVWFLIFKINRKGTYVVFRNDTELFNKLNIGNHTKYNDMVICDFESFFITNKEIITQMCQ